MEDGAEQSVVSGLTHECGVFGCVAAGSWPSQVDVAQVICLGTYIFTPEPNLKIDTRVSAGLVALQHRGQESAGIVTSEGKCARSFNVHKGMGMINNIFNDDNIRKLTGNLGIGHTRYSTSAASEEVNCQPFVVHTAHGALAVAHNGELVNTESLRKTVGSIPREIPRRIFLNGFSLNPTEPEISAFPRNPRRWRSLAAN